jgi:hypothetical protein
MSTEGMWSGRGPWGSFDVTIWQTPAHDPGGGRADTHVRRCQPGGRQGEVVRVWSQACAYDAYQGPALYYTLSFAAVFLGASLTIDINRTSLHHFYRDRLSEAYIVKVDRRADSTTKIVSNEILRLCRLHEHANGAPYHHINTTLNVPASTDRYLRGITLMAAVCHPRP